MMFDRSVTKKNVVVVGFGRSGEAAAKLCARKGARRVIVQDRRDAAEIGEDRLLNVVREGVALELGGHNINTLREAQLIVISPGVPPLPELLLAEAAGVPIVSEVELASWFIQSEIVAITGTNGKSTVTTLIGLMAEQSQRPTFVGGNLGTPLSEAIDTPAADAHGIAVIELSSYQLERTYTLHPKVAVLINLTPDHFDRYPSLAAYGAAKQRIFLSQTPNDHAVVPAYDPVVHAMAYAGAAQVHTWGFTDGIIHVEHNHIVDSDFGRYLLSDLKIAGKHNIENAMAAAISARLIGVSHNHIQHVLSTFEGLPHRMNFVLQEHGIAYYNDSKATNVGAAVKALEGIDRKVVLIGGGRHKGASYDPLRPLLAAKARALVLIGEAAEIMKKELSDVVPTCIASDLHSAVRKARNLARNGDAVLLAPACSSLDMFKNFEERGNAFAASVRQLVNTNRTEETV